MPAGVKPPDRRGQIGSARLLQDIYQLDEYAFDTKKRKPQLTKAISLAPAWPRRNSNDFARREYLDSIHPWNCSVAIFRVITFPQRSHVVISGDVFQTVRAYHGAEQVALASQRDATELLELDAQPEMLLSFEGIGLDTHWEFRYELADAHARLASLAGIFDFGLWLHASSEAN